MLITGPLIARISQQVSPVIVSAAFDHFTEVPLDTVDMCASLALANFSIMNFRLLHRHKAYLE